MALSIAVLRDGGHLVHVGNASGRAWSTLRCFKRASALLETRKRAVRERQVQPGRVICGGICRTPQRRVRRDQPQPLRACRSGESPRRHCRAPHRRAGDHDPLTESRSAALIFSRTNDPPAPAVVLPEMRDLCRRPSRSYLDAHERHCVEIGFHHLQRHAGPAETGAQECVLRPQAAMLPFQWRKHAEDFPSLKLFYPSAPATCSASSFIATTFFYAASGCLARQRSPWERSAARTTCPKGQCARYR